MKIYESNDFSEIYKESLTDLITNPEFKSNPRKLQTAEMHNFMFKLNNPLSSLYKNERRSSQYKYIAGEFLWYFMGRNDLKFIEKYSKFWRNIKNNDDTLNSAYGHLIFKIKNRYNYTQWQWAIDALKKDKNTRQAILHFNMPKHQYQGNKDFVCTLTVVFLIRDNKLMMDVHMRSSDAILGLATDVAFFSTLQQHMLYFLRKTYNNLELGEYFHHTNSLHIYEKHFSLVEEMIKLDFKPDYFPEIQNPFVDIEGKSTKKYIELFDSVKIDKDFYDTDDKFFNWIYKSLK